MFTYFTVLTVTNKRMCRDLLCNARDRVFLAMDDAMVIFKEKAHEGLSCFVSHAGVDKWDGGF